MAGTWRVVCKPEGKNPGRNPDSGEDSNMGSMIVTVTNGTFREEVSRVGWVRRNTKHPDVSFADQIKAEIEKARVAVGILNEQLVSSGETL